MAIIEAAAQERAFSTPTEILAEIRALGVRTAADSVDIVRADRDGR
jgi:hypothetical protein